MSRAVRAWERGREIARAVTAIHRRYPVDLVEIPEVFVPRGLFAQASVAVRLHSAAWTWRRMMREAAPRSDTLDVSLERKLLQRARVVSSPSRFLADYVRRSCNLQSRPVEVIPYPVDTRAFTPGNGGREAALVLFVGRVEKRKGADVLMRAIPDIVAGRPDARFVFIGRLSQDVSHLVLDVAPHAQFLGVLPRSDLIEWYRRATVFVAPSIWDNSPNTIYEAMACGTPVVATSVGGIPELVDHGRTGTLQSPTNPRALATAILSLLDNPSLARRMGACARAKAVDEYSLDRIVGRTLNAYQAALS
jgi:glycosyltransferase involved in cell wall biosynthesis